MTGFIRSCMTSAVATLGASSLVIAPVVTPATARPDPPPVALAVHAQPLAAPTTVASLQPFDIVGQQVGFHVGFVTDFVVTGAQLFARQVPIPGTLLHDLQNGTPLPVAVGRALQTFADVEIDAGRELVGFATEYVNFQIDFLAKVVRDAMTTASSTAIAFAAFTAGVVNQLVTSVVAGLTSASTQIAATNAEPAAVGLAQASTRLATPPAAADRRPDVVETVKDAKDAVRTAPIAQDTVTEQPKKPKQPTPAVETSDIVTGSTVSAQGDVRSATTGTTDTDGVAATDPDDVSRANRGGDDVHAKPEATPRDKGDTEDTHQKDNAPPKDSATNDKPHLQPSH